MLPDPLTLRWTLPVLTILLGQVLLYIWMAPRGFDFTDESYYFNNFSYWREFTGTVTFFGAYFEGPFRLMGESIAAIRILSLVVILTSSAALMHQVLRFSARAHATPGSARPGLPVHWWYLPAPMAASMLYFGYLSTLRAPSYNLLSLCTMALATACLLRVLEQQAAGRASRLAPFLYGLALGACFLSKATTALILVAAHTVFFIAINRAWAWKRLFELFTLIVAGFAVNFLVLTAAFPGWLASLLEGIEIMRVRGGYGMGEMLRGLSWDVQRELMRTGPWLLLSACVFALVRRKLGPAHLRTVSLITVALVAATAAVIAAAHQTSLWLFLMAATAAGLWSLELLASPGARLTRADRAELALMALLFFLPVAFSFGTNMPVLGHSAIASMFAFCAVFLRLYRLSQVGLLGRGALVASACLLCVPALGVQLRALTDVGYTYRQLSPLGQQHDPVTLGDHGAVLRVDQRTQQTLRDIKAMFRNAGFRQGQDVLDLSGDGPGVIYAMGATPLGTPWMIGGYPGSAAAAGRVIEKLDPAALRGAWLLTSTNNPRRIPAWEPMLARHAGPNAHEVVASIDIPSPYSWDPAAPKTVNLQLWRPVQASQRPLPAR